MTSDLEVTGLWWLPGDEANDRPGTLRFDQEKGLRLQLIESFADDIPSEETHPMILGLGTNGKVVTLQHCMWAGYNRPSPGVDSVEYLVRVCYLGHHFLQEEDLKFFKAKVHFSHLASWTELSGIKVKYGARSSGEPEYQVTYDFPDDVTAVLNDADIKISHELQTGGALPPGEVGLQETAFIEVALKNEVSLSELMSKYVRPIQNFLTFATARPNAITGLSVYSWLKSVPTANGKFYPPVLVESDWLYRESEPIRRLSPDDMLFTLSEVQEDFDGVLARWLGMHQELASSCDLFFGLKYRDPGYLETRFLPMVQVAEAFHRARMRNQVLDPVAYKERYDSILRDAPKKHRGWLRERMQYGNEPSFHERFRDLVEHTRTALAPWPDDVEAFIRKVKHTRNFLTHHDQKLKKKAAQGTELHRLTTRVSLIVEACFLAEIGISPENCAELFRNDWRLAFSL